VTAVEVVDASALAALLFGEPEAEAVADRLGSGRLVAPALLDHELANICLKKIRRHPGQREALLRGFGLRERVAIDIVAVDHREVVDLAGAAGLTAYDASYLWLAQRLGAGLVTLDRRLAAVAARG
jgi:predicted nucleic acid-binding protein